MNETTVEIKLDNNKRINLYFVFDEETRMWICRMSDEAMNDIQKLLRT